MKTFLIIFWIHQAIFGLSSLGAVLNLLLEGGTTNHGLATLHGYDHRTGERDRSRSAMTKPNPQVRDPAIIPSNSGTKFD